jgi:hypothetical protein
MLSSATLTPVTADRNPFNATLILHTHLVWLVVGVFDLLSTGSGDKHWVSLTLLSVIMLLLTMMCIMALPIIRNKYHDLFEYTHRFFGWSALLLLWGNVLLTISWSTQTAETGLLVATIKSINLWLAVLIAALILSPWLTVRKVQVQARVQSRAIIEITFHRR